MSKLQVAETILNQLGGGKFLAITGCKKPSGTGNSLQFTLPKNKSKANICEIILDSDDTYTVKFYSLRNYELKDIESATGLHNDMLISHFEWVTGLVTSL